MGSFVSGGGQARAVRVLLVVVGLVVAGACGPGSSEPAGAGGHGSATAPSGDVETGRLAQIQQTQAAAGPEYAVRDAETSPHIANPKHQLRAFFEADSVLVERGEQTISFAWTGMGRASLADVGEAVGELAVHGNEVRSRHGEGLEQWFVNGPLGLEQGFTVALRPDGDGPLVLEVTTHGALPELSGDEVLLTTDDARPLHYSDLFAEDADGTLLPAHFDVDGQHIALVIDDANATYPLRIDPLVWAEVDKLTASDAQAGDRFGRSVAVSGDTAIVGASGESGGAGDPLSFAGAAYVFERDAGGTWNEVAILHASDAQANDTFGRSVAVSGDRAIVGAPFESGGAGDPLSLSGAVYLFERDAGGSWNEVAILRASDAQANDAFGYSVAVSGDRAIAGAYGEDGGAGDPLTQTGAAYIFERDAGGIWNEVAILRASDAQAEDTFGNSVAVSGDRAIVGAPGEDGGTGDPLNGAGAAYVFERDAGGSWDEVAILRASDAQADDFFGPSVAVSGDRAIVGAFAEDGGAGSPLNDAGAAYLFERDAGGSWNEVAILHASDAQASDLFSLSVAVSGDSAIVGAHAEDGGAGDPLDGAGAVYVFREKEQEVCDNGVDDDGDGDADCADSECDALACDDGNDCTAGEVCTFATATCGSGANEPDLTACDDGSFCNGADTCDAGACTNHAGTPCPDDTLFCNGAESCNDTTDACETTGTQCADDGAFCNGAESCNENTDACETTGTQCADDGAFCNGAESCNETTDACETTGDPCPDDGLFCTGTESCNDTTDSCEATGDPCPDDGLFCTGTESCNDTTDACETTGDPCPDDGLFCTGTESCNDTTDACEATGDPCAANIGDADVDCSESCDDTADACEANDPQGSSCTDGVATGTCDATGTCFFAQGQTCTDAGDCLSGFCVDGVCCDGACDGACERCNEPGSAGTCSAEESGVSCRAAAVECDAAEVCDGVSHACPEDVAVPNGTECTTGVCTDGTCADDPSGSGGMTGAGGDMTGAGGGMTGTGGGSAIADPTEPEGCSCQLPGRQRTPSHAGWLLLLLGLGVTTRRQRAHGAR